MIALHQSQTKLREKIVTTQAADELSPHPCFQGGIFPRENREERLASLLSFRARRTKTQPPTELFKQPLRGLRVGSVYQLCDRCLLECCLVREL